MSRQMKKRLATFGIDVRRLPLGMTRQKENGTNVHRASGRIHWQVEWLLLESRADPVHDVQKGETDTGEKETDKWKRTRILSKAMDDSPLCVAFTQAQTQQTHRLRKEVQQTRDNPEDSPTNPTSSKSRQKPPPGTRVDVAQDPITGSWHPGPYALQFYPNSAWKSRSGAAPFTGVVGVDPAQASKFSFYLASSSPTASHRNKTVVHPVDPTTTLAETLRDTTVVEFPTLFVLPSSEALPSTFSVCPKSSRPKQVQREHDRERNDGSLQSQRKRPRDALEEGEVASDDEQEESELGGSGNSSGEEDAGPDSLDEGDCDDDASDIDAGVDVIADDTTSSSGSDTSSDESESCNAN